MNHLLEIILERISQKKKLIEQVENKETDNLLNKIEDFEKLIQIFINLQPEKFFKEVKSLFLNEFESTSFEIKNCLEMYQNQKTSK